MTKDDHLTQGRRAENLACEFLEKQGLKLLTRNYRCKAGEIDLIMQNTAGLVFVEVRFRRNTRYGSGADTVDWRKQARINAAAAHYLQRTRGFSRACRFDVISITEARGRYRVDWISDAFRQD